MDPTTRQYPDISFVDTDTEKLVNDLIRSYERITNRKLYPADPVRHFILWIADIIMQERIILDFSAKQNVPRYAQAEYLDSLAELFKDTHRLEPEKAQTVLQFTLSMALESTNIIPAGTRATVDGKIVFQTLYDLEIPAGELKGEVAAECLTAGKIGNGFVAGQINQLIDIFPYFQSVQNISASDGGADKESDAAFYERMRQSMETFSTAGTLGGYTYFAKSASGFIADVKTTSPSPGVVDIRVLMQDGKLPGEEILNKVTAALSAEDVRPLTDRVQVSAPETVSYNIDLTYYTNQDGALSTSVIEQNAAQAVSEFQNWQSAKMGRDIDPSELIYRIKQAGVKRVEVRSPVYTPVKDNAVAQIGTVSVTNGGEEDE